MKLLALFGWNKLLDFSKQNKNRDALFGVIELKWCEGEKRCEGHKNSARDVKNEKRQRKNRSGVEGREQGGKRARKREKWPRVKGEKEGKERGGGPKRQRRPTFLSLGRR